MIPKDPAILLSFVNMKLRDSYSSLDDLCADLDVDPAAISAALLLMCDKEVIEV